MSDLREALEAHEADYNLKMVADHHVAVVAAARRFLALTETGQRIEWCKVHRGNPSDCERKAVYDEFCEIIQLIPADYLTEEDR